MIGIADTDVMVDILREHPPAAAWFYSHREFPAVCGVTALELYAGCRNRSEAARVRAMLRPLRIAWPSPLACAAALYAFPGQHLASRLGILDSLIAACTLELGVPLYTFNSKHFRAVEGLDVQQPYVR